MSSPLSNSLSALDPETVFSIGPVRGDCPLEPQLFPLCPGGGGCWWVEGWGGGDLLAALYSWESMLWEGHRGQMAFSQPVWVKQSHDTNVCPLTQQRVEDAAVTAALISKKHWSRNLNWHFVFLSCLVILSFFWFNPNNPVLRVCRIPIFLVRWFGNLFTSPSRALSGSLWLFLRQRHPLQMSYYPPTECPLVGMTVKISGVTRAPAAAAPVWWGASRLFKVILTPQELIAQGKQPSPDEMYTRNK